MIRTII